MRERLLVIAVVAVLTVAAAPAISALLPESGSMSGLSGVVYADGPTPVPTPPASNCHGGSSCGG